ncbi:VOC family protein [Actinokineospora auranticolor]|uniref:Catechol 2,3-dioxygenase-like lactoylglutathione lyase family enzyme n=1 Tax=Actinokineospora auranticolor TaxID=155976 RepID=A0A2S6GYF3_9PSEU|nr:VOC family protein [Actinokineospora auranticolor]PPK70206.1 catechol 2,3-dioxygenase-like lactoylglutathione lyase family enzyme [Actinokineospora auranticolor]
MTLTAGETVEAAQRALVRQVKQVSAAVSVSNLDDSIAWYADNLGFEVVTRQDFPAINARVAYIRNRKVVLELVQAEPAVRIHRPAPPFNYVVQGFAQLSLYVDDIATAKAQALAQGLSLVSDIVSAPDLGVQVFLLQDLDGNLIEVAQASWLAAGSAAAEESE